MFLPDRTDQPFFTSARLVHACEAAEARLAPLITVLAPLARSRPDAAVSPDLLADARQAFRPTSRLARGLKMAPPLPLHGPVTHAALAARLAIAATQARVFRERYFRFDRDAHARVWFVHAWISSAMRERHAEAMLEGWIPWSDELPSGPKVSHAKA